MKDRKIIFKCRVGSHLYGLSTPESDEDFMGVFIPSEEDILGMTNVKQVNNSTKSSSVNERNTKDDTDDVMYALPEFLKLLLANNPNIVETLFINPENIIICEPEFQELIDNYEKIISTKVYHSFGGYSYGQKRKLVTKRERYNNLHYAVNAIEEVYPEYRSIQHIDDVISEWLNSIVKYYKGAKNNVESFHKGMDFAMIYDKLKAEKDKYGWRVKTDSFNKLGFDLKFAYHLIRILAEGEQILKTGKLEYPISGVVRDHIMDIRNSKVEFDELMFLYDVYYSNVEKAYEETSLRHTPDHKWANKYLVRTLKKSIIEV